MIKIIALLLIFTASAWAGIPQAISDLTATPGTNQGDVNLTWTATGDNGRTGTANSYLVRYSTLSEIVYDNFIDSYTNAGLWATTVCGDADGNDSETGGELIVNTAGTDDWTTRSDYRMIYTTITGNTDMVLKISSCQAGTGSYTSCGLRVKNSTATAASNSMVIMAWGAKTYTFSNNDDSNDNGYLDVNNTETLGGSIGTQPVWIWAYRRATTFSMYYATGSTNVVWNTPLDAFKRTHATAQPKMIWGMSAIGHDGPTPTRQFRYDIVLTSGIYHWDRATVATPISPSVAGTRESMTVSGLTLGTTYFFCVRPKAADGNITDGSNSPNSLPQRTTPVAIRKKKLSQIICVE